MIKTHTLILSLCALSILVSSPLKAESIQMLPPIQSGTAITPCIAGDSSKILSWDGKNAIQCQAGAMIDASGNVGIGNTAPTAKLDVTGTANVSGNQTVGGSVKVGSDTSICTSVKMGTVRSNSGEMQFCDGSSWKRLATGPLFGGIFQTYLCDPSKIYHAADPNGGCRVPNTVTGACSCPDGYTLQRINDYSVPAGSCPQSFYEARGMMQWLCVKP